jgi:hypothetical protein
MHFIIEDDARAQAIKNPPEGGFLINMVPEAESIRSNNLLFYSG